MRPGRAVVITVAVALGLLAAWGVGSAQSDCEYTCPATGPCPRPADCLSHPFNWPAAVVLGCLVALVAAVVGAVVLRANTKE